MNAEPKYQAQFFKDGKPIQGFDGLPIDPVERIDIWNDCGRYEFKPGDVDEIRIVILPQGTDQ